MKQYFYYFKFVFLGLVLMAIVTGILSVASYMGNKRIKHNSESPEERVYDYADILTEEEEDDLRSLIAKTESEIAADIVLVTIKESIIGYGGHENNWDRSMEAYADDFYDNHKYGYNKVHGDGVLLLDNWYEEQKGSWLSTCGKIYQQYSNSMINEILDDVYVRVESNPYLAYRSYIQNVASFHSQGSRISPLVCLIIPSVAAVIFAFIHLDKRTGKKTTTSETYVQGGAPEMKVVVDQLVDKAVTSRVIQASSGSGGSSGGGGGHRSSGGVSHGGGGRRR